MRGVINCPAGLGDILFCQRVFLELWERYPEIEQWVWPVSEVYGDIVEYWNASTVEKGLMFSVISQEQAKTNYDLAWNSTKVAVTQGPDLWFHIISADRRNPDSSRNLMFPKWDEWGISREEDWRDSWFLPEMTFEHDRVKNLMKVISNDQNISVDLLRSGNFILVNGLFGTPPGHKKAYRVQEKAILNSNTDFRVIEMMFYDDTNLWDWIPVIRAAGEIHTVETSVCYLVDKFATSNKLYQYEKREDDAPRNYFRFAEGVYRNTKWRYEGVNFYG